MAYAALSDLRLIEVKVVEEKVEKDRDGQILATLDRHLFNARPGNPYVDCVSAMRLDGSAWKGVDPELLILSIAAAENYNRQFLHRRFETLTDRLAGAVGIDLDPTLGVTQIRASRARALLNARVPIPLNRAEVADFLENDCNALNVTAWWFEDELKVMGRDGVAPTVQTLALRYNGGTGYHASEFPYAMVVAAAYHMLGPALDGTIGEPRFESTNVRLDTAACFYFDAWGKSVTEQRYVAVRENRTRILSRPQFLAMLGDTPKLRFAVMGPTAWTGVVGAKLKAHVGALVGVKDGRWLGRRTEPLDDPDQVQGLCQQLAGNGDFHVVALLAREGKQDVQEALLAVRYPTEPEPEPEPESDARAAETVAQDQGVTLMPPPEAKD